MAFLMMRKAGGSGAWARKSPTEQLGGANSFVCRHNSWEHTTDTTGQDGDGDQPWLFTCIFVKNLV